MPTSKLLCLALGSLAAALPAQEKPTEFDRLSKKLSFRLANDGRVQIAPDPSTGGDAQKFADLIDPDFMNVLQSGGAATWLAIFYQGSTDLASMTDAQTMLSVLGHATPQKLAALIESQPQSHHAGLLRLLAIRHAGDAKIQGTVDAVQRALTAGIADPHTKRAAQESLAALRGLNAKLPSASTTPIAKLLEKASGGIDYVAYYDMRKMPAARQLLSWGRSLGLAMVRQGIREAGGELSLASVAGAQRMTMAPSLAPYELARRFGNHRATRVVAFGRFPSPDEPTGTHWVSVDGQFDPDRLRAGLRQVNPGLELGKKAGRLDYADDFMQLSMTKSTFHSLPADDDAQAANPEVAKQLAAELGPTDATISFLLRKQPEIPELPPQVAKLGIPRRISIWLPATSRDPLRIQLVCKTSQLATTIANQVKDLPRLLDRQVEELTEQQGRTLEPVLDALDAMKLHREKATVTVSIPCDGIDVEKLVKGMIDTVGKGN